mgnify:CR=1 FL=1
MLSATLWGTRGSIPVSGDEYRRYGGSTTCIEIRVHDAAEGTPRVLVIDCGTGMSNLGRQWGDRGDELTILQTHMHWDHIQGFPFFGPLFNPKGRYRFMSTPRQGHTMKETVYRQMSQPNLPFTLDMVPCTVDFEDIEQIGETQMGELRVSWVEVGHPFGCTTYRFDYRGHSLVFATDIELAETDMVSFEGHCRDADLLIMDSQYFPEEYVGRRGFGHSSVVDCVQHARNCGVSRLLLTHHDPGHDDETLDRKLVLARETAAGALEVEIAHDGLTVNVERAVGQSAAVAS